MKSNVDAISHLKGVDVVLAFMATAELVAKGGLFAELVAWRHWK